MFLNPNNFFQFWFWLFWFIKSEKTSRNKLKKHSVAKNDLSLFELLQLNRTQFSSLGIFVSKEIEKTKTTFNISVLKVVYYVALVFFEIQLFC